MRDETWFAEAYGKHYPSLVRYGLRRLADADGAAELAQEVFVVAWRRRHDVPDHPLPWLYGVARRLLANTWRARRNAPVLVELSNTIAVAANDDTQVTLLDVQAALDTLSDNDQEILRLVGWEQLTVTEAAVVMGCGRATAGMRLKRARRRLTAALNQVSVSPARQVDAVPAPVRN